MYRLFKDPLVHHTNPNRNETHDEKVERLQLEILELQKKKLMKETKELTWPSTCP